MRAQGCRHAVAFALLVGVSIFGVCTEAFSPSDLLDGMGSGMEAPTCDIKCADGTSPKETLR